jgi:bidirectional [NiFe] hydrogenase diaphorase subunit
MQAATADAPADRAVPATDPRGSSGPPVPDRRGAEAIVADPRWRPVDTRIRQLGGRADALIEVLHVVQQQFGFLSTDALAAVSEALAVPPSQVMGVASFYAHFTLVPRGRHDCVICTGTVCYLDGADTILERVERAVRLDGRPASGDGSVSVRGARCVGVCAMSPAAVLDGRLAGRVDAAGLEHELRQW